MSQKPITYPLVMVEWTDSYGCSSSWEEIPSQPPPQHHCFSVGWLIHDSDDVIVVVPHITPQHDEIGAEENGCGDMTIPKCSVVNVTKLRRQ